MVTITCRQINWEVNKEVQQDEKEVDQMFYRAKILNTEKWLKRHHAGNCSSCPDITNASKKNFILWFYPKNCSHATFFKTRRWIWKTNRTVFLNDSRSHGFYQFWACLPCLNVNSLLYSPLRFSHKLVSTSNLGKLHLCTEVIEVLLKEQSLVSECFV